MAILVWLLDRSPAIISIIAGSVVALMVAPVAYQIDTFDDVTIVLVTLGVSLFAATMQRIFILIVFRH